MATGTGLRLTRCATSRSLTPEYTGPAATSSHITMPVHVKGGGVQWVLVGAGRNEGAGGTHAEAHMMSGLMPRSLHHPLQPCAPAHTGQCDNTSKLQQQRCNSLPTESVDVIGVVGVGVAHEHLGRRVRDGARERGAAQLVG